MKKRKHVDLDISEELDVRYSPNIRVLRIIWKKLEGYIANKATYKPNECNVSHFLEEFVRDSLEELELE